MQASALQDQQGGASLSIYDMHDCSSLQAGIASPDSQHAVAGSDDAAAAVELMLSRLQGHRRNAALQRQALA